MKQYDAVAVIINVAYEVDVIDEDGHFGQALRIVSQMLQCCNFPDGSNLIDGNDRTLHCKTFKKRRSKMDLLIGMAIGAGATIVGFAVIYWLAGNVHPFG